MTVARDSRILYLCLNAHYQEMLWHILETLFFLHFDLLEMDWHRPHTSMYYSWKITRNHITIWLHLPLNTRLLAMATNMIYSR